MNWWCSAQGQAWSWTWQPYVGVWLLVALMLSAYGYAFRNWKPHNARDTCSHRTRVSRFTTGVVVFWLAADWPIGALGAGYLLSIHTLQYILFAFVVPPLLISGAPKWMLRRLIEGKRRFAVAQTLSRPLIAFLIFNGVMLATHFPGVVDGLTTSQLGSFAIAMAWLVSGIIFWWPILAPLPELRPLPYPGRLLYLLANIFLPTIPASFMTFAEYPIYALYELAPPMSGLSAVEDQQLAGLLMKLLGGFIIFGTGTALFFKWWRLEEPDDDIDNWDSMSGQDDDGNSPTPDAPSTPADGRRPAVIPTA